MPPQQYQLWIATWNLGIQSGLTTSQALAAADKAAATLKD